MTNYIKVVECSDHDEVYGILKVENVSVNDVQQKIYEIKNDEKFLEECPDWTIEDVFSEFPSEWKWDFISGDNAVEI